jgi:hypothetical protein
VSVDAAANAALARGRSRAAWLRDSPVVVVPLVITLAGFAQGGYFPTAWGWTALALLWVVLASLLVARPERVSTGAVVSVGALSCYLALTALSSIWATGANGPIRSAQLAVVYVAGLVAALLSIKRGGERAALGALVAATTTICAYALATRLLPDRLGTFDSIAGYRLSAPFGYWNALGAFAAIGTLVALGLAAHTRSKVAAALAAASVPLTMTALYFTYSRGAWAALAFGLAGAIAVNPRRFELAVATLLLAVPTTAAVWLASRSPALTRQQVSVQAAAADGHRFAAQLAAIVGVTALAAFALRAAPLPSLSRGGRRAVGVGMAGLAVAALLAALVHFGGPVDATRSAWRSFTAASPPRNTTNLNKRLFSLSANGRTDQWRVALHEYRAHPVLGGGAGSYEAWWLRNRPVDSKVRNAHSLYLEALAELGPLGLALLVLAFGAPLVAGIRARAQPAVPVAFGAYIAYLVHAGVDWDWQVPAVTLAALVCGAVLLNGSPAAVRVGRRTRGVVIATTVALTCFAFVSLVGNIELSRAGNAARAGDWSRSATHARRARAWEPWSPQPWQRLGVAQLALGEGTRAQASLRKAIAKDGNDWELWFDLARATTGAPQADALAQAAKLNPRSPEIAELRREIATQ